MQIVVTSRAAMVAAPGDLCNLLQVAASALHLLDLKLDDELRPLARAGLAAIREAARSAPMLSAANTVYLTRSIS